MQHSATDDAQAAAEAATWSAKAERLQLPLPLQA